MSELKKMILNPLTGFKTETITMPEWKGDSIIIREVTIDGWGKFNAWQKEGDTTAAITAILIDVTHDTDGNPMFSNENDFETLRKCIGPVQLHIFNKAIEISQLNNPHPAESAEKK